MAISRVLRVAASVGAVAALSACSSAVSRPGDYSWQQSHAKVLPTGDLQWAPRDFEFQKGEVVRYIDFDKGSDSYVGDSADHAWKHHPWDPAASANAKAFTAPATYVFKRGVVYRGHLQTAAASGSAKAPVRLTSDPSWGKGEAIIAGSEPVTGWSKGGLASMPAADRVWHVELSYAPRRIFIRKADASLERLTLARTPNWTWSNPDDYRAEWFSWEQPEWWTGKNTVVANGTKMHQGVDTQHLTGDPEQYKDAIVWSEYGIVMGSPFATRVEAYDPAKKAVAFRGPWGGGDDEKIIANNRYFIEDKPQFLDVPGEFWFDKKGDGGTLYVRLPGDADPNTLKVEAAKYYTLLDAKKLEHVQISGLAFQAQNTFFDLTARPFANPEVESAGIRLMGSGDDIAISNCSFEQLTGGIQLRANADSDRIGSARITDNHFINLDRFAIRASDSSSYGKSDAPFSTFDHVDVLRNRVELVGLRGGRDCHGHSIEISFLNSTEVAGNIIDHVGGSGIFVFGGKGSDELRDKPFSRSLIHHNKVTEGLMITNDWGQIETWQGGPHYLWSNISARPGGYWNWVFASSKGKPAEKVEWGAASQGFTYYFDGSFKNYVFNNIAIGKSNVTNDPRCSPAAYQQCIGYQNTFFNNTAWNFATGHRRQAPRAGRDKWLGNVFDSISDWTFLDAEPREGASDANAFQFQDIKGSNYALETDAYGSNVIHGQSRHFGVFEESGITYASLADLSAAMQKQKLIRSDVGMMSEKPVLADPAKGDFRPAKDSLVAGKGVKTFVPWSLYATVGEWNFLQNQKDPAVVMDEHWYMRPYYTGREDNWRTPRHALTGVNITASDYVNGPLEGWCKGAIRLDGRGKYLVARHADLVAPYSYDSKGKKLTVQGDDIASPEVGSGSFLIEAYFRTERDHVRGGIARKVGKEAGYTLELSDGGYPMLSLASRSKGYTLRTLEAVNDGQWHHVIAEVDRKANRANMYIDGILAATGVIPSAEEMPLANTGDFIVGRSNKDYYFAGDIDFLRVCRGTLADSQTTIDELYTWEFDGPQFRDFASRKPTDGKRDAGAIQAQ